MEVKIIQHPLAEKGECMIMSISMCTGEDYSIVKRRFEDRGWSVDREPDPDFAFLGWSQGTQDKGTMRTIMYLMGYNPAFYHLPKNQKIKDLDNIHHEGSFIFITKGHAICVKDGVLMDSYDSSESEVVGFFVLGSKRFEKDEESDEVKLYRRSKKIELLDRYSKFLEDRGYLDTDYKEEEPYAIDEFMKEEDKNKE